MCKELLIAPSIMKSIFTDKKMSRKTRVFKLMAHCYFVSNEYKDIEEIKKIINKFAIDVTSGYRHIEYLVWQNAINPVNANIICVDLEEFVKNADFLASAIQNTATPIHNKIELGMQVLCIKGITPEISHALCNLFVHIDCPNNKPLANSTFSSCHANLMYKWMLNKEKEESNA